MRSERRGRSGRMRKKGSEGEEGRQIYSKFLLFKCRYMSIVFLSLFLVNLFCYVKGVEGAGERSFLS